LEVLYSILAKAFDIKSEFGISYKTQNPTTGKCEYLVVLSDWDLDSAFLRYYRLLSAHDLNYLIIFLQSPQHSRTK
jgi:hypothetical protein